MNRGQGKIVEPSSLYLGSRVGASPTAPTKQCTKCKKFYLIEEGFYFKNKKRNLRRSACKQCCNTQYYEWCKKNSDAQENHKTRVHEIRQRTRQAIRDFIQNEKSKPCVDCNKRYPYFVMDFDHVRGEKIQYIYCTTKILQNTNHSKRNR